MKPGPNSRVEDIEVVDADPALGLVPVEPDDSRPGRPSSWWTEDPLELLGGDDGHHAEAALALGPLRYGRTWSSLRSSQRERSGFFKYRIGMFFVAAKPFTSRRKRLPIFSITAGEAIGLPRCSLQNRSTCPPTCRLGTYAFR